MSFDRPDKASYYLKIARDVASRSTCLRRQYGAVIVNNDEIVATGYNGAPRGCPNCNDRGICYRAEHNIPRGTRYEFCAANGTHAEQNAIMSAGRQRTKGATLYIMGYDREAGAIVDKPDCCQMCKRAIINAGIEYVVLGTTEPDEAGKIKSEQVWTREWITRGVLIPSLEGY